MALGRDGATTLVLILLSSSGPQFALGGEAMSMARPQLPACLQPGQHGSVGTSWEQQVGRASGSISAAQAGLALVLSDEHELRVQQALMQQMGRQAEAGELTLTAQNVDTPQEVTDARNMWHRSRPLGHTVNNYTRHLVTALASLQMLTNQAAENANQALSDAQNAEALNDRQLHCMKDEYNTLVGQHTSLMRIYDQDLLDKAAADAELQRVRDEVNSIEALELQVQRNQTIADNMMIRADEAHSNVTLTEATNLQKVHDNCDDLVNATFMLQWANIAYRDSENVLYGMDTNSARGLEEANRLLTLYRDNSAPVTISLAAFSLMTPALKAADAEMVIATLKACGYAIGESAAGLSTTEPPLSIMDEGPSWRILVVFLLFLNLTLAGFAGYQANYEHDLYSSSIVRGTVAAETYMARWKDDFWHVDRTPQLASYGAYTTSAIQGMVAGTMMQAGLPDLAVITTWVLIGICGCLMFLSRHWTLQVQHKEKWLAREILEDVIWYKNSVQHGFFQSWWTYFMTPTVVICLVIFASFILVGLLLQMVLPDDPDDWTTVPAAIMVCVFFGLCAQCAYLKLRIKRLESWHSVRLEESMKGIGNAFTQDTYDMFHKDEHPELPGQIAWGLSVLCGLFSGTCIQSGDGLFPQLALAFDWLIFVVIIFLMAFIRHQYKEIGQLSEWVASRLWTDLWKGAEKEMRTSVYVWLDNSFSRGLYQAVGLWLLGMLCGFILLCTVDTLQNILPFVTLAFALACAATLSIVIHHLHDKITHMGSWGTVILEEKLEGRRGANPIWGKRGMLDGLITPREKCFGIDEENWVKVVVVVGIVVVVSIVGIVVLGQKH